MALHAALPTAHGMNGRNGLASRLRTQFQPRRGRHPPDALALDSKVLEQRLAADEPRVALFKLVDHHCGAWAWVELVERRAEG